MNRQEHLLSCLAEECAEVAQRVSKALRFGLDEVQEGQLLPNSARISQELSDLVAVASILRREGMIPFFAPDDPVVRTKLDKIERYMDISRAQGVLQDGEGQTARADRRNAK